MQSQTACAPNRFNQLAQLAVDLVSNTLFVADFLNHRVMVFFAAHTKPDTSNADLVLGQPDFVTCTFACTATNMNEPAGVSFDSASGTLFVGDFSNNRFSRKRKRKDNTTTNRMTNKLSHNNQQPTKNNME